MEVAVNRWLVSLFLLMFASPVTAMSVAFDLTWVPAENNVDGTPYTDAAGYRIAYGFESGNYTQSVMIQDPYVTAHTLEIHGVESGSTIFVAMKSVDINGLESVWSTEVAANFTSSDSLSPGPPEVGGTAYILSCDPNRACLVHPAQ